MKTVLIVEDDEGIGEVLVQFILQETPFHALLVTKGRDALEAVKDTRPSLLLLDYHLPDMTGLELYDRLLTKKELATIPAIMLSAHLPMKEVAKRKMVGMHKPVELEDLLTMIVQLIA